MVEAPQTTTPIHIRCVVHARCCPSNESNSVYNIKCLTPVCVWHRRRVIQGRRTIGKVTNCSAMLTTHTPRNMRPHSRRRNWVRGSTLFFPPFWHSWLDCTAEANLNFVFNTMCLWWAITFFFLSQVNLCGVDTLGSPHLLTILSATHAHSCYR